MGAARRSFLQEAANRHARGKRHADAPQQFIRVAQSIAIGHGPKGTQPGIDLSISAPIGPPSCDRTIRIPPEVVGTL